MEKKPRASKYDEKLRLDMGFKDFFKIVKKNKEEKQENHIHKNFQLDYPEGSIDVHFNIEKIDDETSITNIQVQANFNLGIPESPKMEWDNDRYKLYSTHIRKDKVEVHEYFNTNISNEIVEEILKRKDEDKTKKK